MEKPRTMLLRCVLSNLTYALGELDVVIKIAEWENEGDQDEIAMLVGVFASMQMAVDDLTDYFERETEK